MMHQEQERLLWLFLFLNNLPLLKICVWAITPELFGIYTRNFSDGCIISRRYFTNKKDHWLCQFSNYLPLSKIHVWTIRIYTWNFTDGCIISRWYVGNKQDNYDYFCFWITFPCLNPCAITPKSYGIQHENLQMVSSLQENVLRTNKTTVAVLFKHNVMNKKDYSHH